MPKPKFEQAPHSLADACAVVMRDKRKGKVYQVHLTVEEEAAVRDFIALLHGGIVRLAEPPLNLILTHTNDEPAHVRN